MQYSSASHIVGIITDKLRVRFSAEGLENIAEGAGVLAAKHVNMPETYIIPQIIYTETGRIAHAFANKKINGIRYLGLGRLANSTGAFIPVDPAKAGIPALKRTMRTLEEGNLLEFFPEGHRFDNINKPEPGLARMLYQLYGKKNIDVPAYPTYLETDRVFPNMWPEKDAYCTLKVGKPIYISEFIDKGNVTREHMEAGIAAFNERWTSEIEKLSGLKREPPK
jgi:1-acyl-sn-glycerol-3-phosphate acyltransferase